MAKTDDDLKSIFIHEGELVFIDLETTGLEADCDILQIAAWHGEKLFAEYVIPSKSINPAASKVNKIVMLDGKMLYDGTEVHPVERREALEGFRQYSEGVGSAVVLVAHNGVSFDFPRLIRQLHTVDLCLPENIVYFLDSKPLIKELYPGLKSYSQVDLVGSLMDSSYVAHEATEDARILQKLIKWVINNTEPEKFRDAVQKHLLPRDSMLRKVKLPEKLTMESQLERLSLSP